MTDCPTKTSFERFRLAEKSTLGEIILNQKEETVRLLSFSVGNVCLGVWMRRKWLEDAQQVVVTCLDVGRVREGNSTGTPGAGSSAHAAPGRLPRLSCRASTEPPDTVTFTDVLSRFVQSDSYGVDFVWGLFENEEVCLTFFRARKLSKNYVGLVKSCKHWHF